MPDANAVNIKKDQNSFKKKKLLKVRDKKSLDVPYVAMMTSLFSILAQHKQHLWIHVSENFLQVLYILDPPHLPLPQVGVSPYPHFLTQLT